MLVGKNNNYMEKLFLHVNLVNHPSIVSLLDNYSVEEFGYEQRGVITVPLDVQHFRRVVDSISVKAEFKLLSSPHSFNSIWILMYRPLLGSSSSGSRSSFSFSILCPDSVVLDQDCVAFCPNFNLIMLLNQRTLMASLLHDFLILIHIK